MSTVELDLDKKIHMNNCTILWIDMNHLQPGMLVSFAVHCQELQASLKARLWQRPSANLGPMWKRLQKDQCESEI